MALFVLVRIGGFLIFMFFKIFFQVRRLPRPWAPQTGGGMMYSRCDLGAIYCVFGSGVFQFCLLTKPLLVTTHLHSFV